MSNALLEYATQTLERRQSNPTTLAMGQIPAKELIDQHLLPSWNAFRNPSSGTSLST
jgi:hypothetical protein